MHHMMNMFLSSIVGICFIVYVFGDFMVSVIKDWRHTHPWFPNKKKWVLRKFEE
jgi:hypothetical protein